MSKTVTIIGSLNYDLVTFTKKVPKAGETIQANSFETHMGGKGLNEAVAVARLSPPLGHVQSRMIGCVGADDFGKSLKQCLVDSGVDVSNVKTIEGESSGVATILVEEESGENRILITAGANGHLKPSDEEYKSIFELDKEDKNEYVVLQNEYPDTAKSISWLKTNRPNINIAYNPSPYRPELVTRDIWSKIDLLIVNEGEAQDVAKLLLPDLDLVDSMEGVKTLAVEIQKLLNQNNLKTVVITLGSKGCIYYNAQLDEPQFVQSRKVDNVIDTTGAGDTFFGGLVSNLALGKTLAQAVEFATAASSLAIQKKGAAEGIPEHKDVIQLLGE